MRVLDPHSALFHPQNAVRDIAELKHIALQALDGEVLVDRADELTLRLEDDLIVGVIGDRAARSDRRQTRAAPAAQHVVDGIVMDQCTVAAAAGGEALRQHAHDGIEFRPLEIAVRVCPASECEQTVFVPFACRDFRHDLLGEHVERSGGNGQTIKLTAAHRIEQRGALDEIVARQRKEPPLGRTPDRVAGPTHALQECGDRSWRAQLTHEVDVADVDAQLERCGGDQRAQLAALEPAFRVEPQLLCHAAVMSRDLLCADPLREVACDALCVPPCVDEDECSAVLAHELGQPVIDLRPRLARHDRLQRRGRDFELQIALPHMPRVDDRTVGLTVAADVVRAHQEARDLLDRLLGGRQSYTRQPAPGERFQPLQ